MGLQLRVLRAVCAAVAVCVATAGAEVRWIDGRLGNKARQRMDWDTRRDSLTEPEFKRRYRLSKRAFARLSAKIKPLVAKKTSRTPSPISADLKLSMTLRWLCGGHYLDIVDMHGVHSSTFFDALWDTCEAICKVEKLAFPFDDAAELNAIKRGFRERSREWFPGYWNRKSFFALNVQAIADARYKFLWFGLHGRGSTHDSMAFGFSTLARDLAAGRLGDHYIVADDAYVASDWVLTPWSSPDVPKDAFNYYQSRARMVVEQAFGIYVRRWGVLQKKLDVSIYHASLVVGASVEVETTMKLHNICCDEGEYASSLHVGTAAGYRDADGNVIANPDPYFQDECATETLAGRRRDLEKSAPRTFITQHMQRQGACRPAYATQRRNR